MAKDSLKDTGLEVNRIGRLNLYSAADKLAAFALGQMLERRGAAWKLCQQSRFRLRRREKPNCLAGGWLLASLPVIADVLFRLFDQAAIADEDRAALVQAGGLDIQDVSMTI